MRAVDADGAARGAPVTLSGAGFPHEGVARLAALPDGGFVVGWGRSGGLRLQRFDASGRAVGEALEPFDREARDLTLAPTSMGFAASFEGTSLGEGGPYAAEHAYVQLFDSSGLPLGEARRVSDGSHVSYATLVDGGSAGPALRLSGESRTETHLVRLGADGRAADLVRLDLGEHVVLDYSPEAFLVPLGGGGTLVVYERWPDRGVFAAALALEGKIKGEPQRIGADGAGAVRATALPDGTAVAAWLVAKEGEGGWGVLNVQRFGPDGLARGGVVEVELVAPGGGTKASGTGLDVLALAASSSGEIAALWSGVGTDAPNGTGLVLQRLATEAALTGVEGSRAVDTLRGGFGNDLIAGRDGDDMLSGGGGSDSLLGGRGNDDLRGEADADRLHGGEQCDRLRGQDGDDELRGDGGADRLYGGLGADLLFGGTGRDRLKGGADTDRLHGGEQGDRLRGEDGDDELNGDRGRDLLYGEAGDDTLRGGPGRDEAWGGQGADTFVLSEGDGRLVIHDFEAGRDTILLDRAFAFDREAATGALPRRLWIDDGDAILRPGHDDDVVRIKGVTDLDAILDAIA